MEQNWVKGLRYHPQKGFYHARDADGKRYLLLDNQVPSNTPGRTDSFPDALRQFNIQFETRWFCGSFLDPIWSANIPEGHSVMPPAAVKHVYTDTLPNQLDPGANKRAKLGGKKPLVPDFISSTLLMEPTVPLPAHTKSATMTII